MPDPTVSGTSKMWAVKDVILMVGERRKYLQDACPYFLPWVRRLFSQEKTGIGR
jgi:hypothetical protein